MKNTITLLLAIVVFAACGSKEKKQEIRNNSVHKYIYVVENVEGYDVAYTEDGHTLIYSNDSIGDFIAYYAKFNDNAGRFDRIKDKVVRIDVDSSLNSLKSILFFYGGIMCDRGGIMCDRSNDMRHVVYYFDEKMNENEIEYIDTPSNPEIKESSAKEYRIRMIRYFIDVAYQLVDRINNGNAHGWYNIAPALESSQDILMYEIMFNDTIYDPKVMKRISKISKTTEWFKQYHSELQGKMISKNDNNIQKKGNNNPVYNEKAK